MFGRQHQTNRFLWAGVALVVLGLAPQAGRAQAIIFRNDTNMALVVQVTAGFKGQVQRTRPILLAPKANSGPIRLPGDKQVAVYDANLPTRVLFKDFLPPSPYNRAFSIQPDPPARVKLHLIQFPH
jgi:hypothetical protein